MQRTDHRPAAALILAAGLGTRFGGRKLLAPIAGKPMLQHVLDVAADAGLAPVVVVLGLDADEVSAACTWWSERRVVNREPQLGLSASLRVGLKAVESSAASRVVVMMGDQPFLTRQQLAAVVAARGQIIVPRYLGRAGNPVVLDRSVWPLAASLQGDRGFSQIFGAYPHLVTFVDLPGTNPDIDTPADLDSTANEANAT